MSPVWMHIDLSTLRKNAAWVAKQAGGMKRVWAVVKANAYGHGAVAVARACEQAGVAGLAVVSHEEGLELREAGVKAAILVLNPGRPKEAAVTVRYDLVQTACTHEMLYALSRAARAQGRPARIHIKVDTGMARLGVQPEEAPSFIQEAHAMPGVSVEGLFSHFATADGTDERFLREQIARFRGVLAHLEPRTVRSLKWIHFANSAAVVRHAPVRRRPFTAVRPGLMLYGGQPIARGSAAVEPVMSVHTRVWFVKEVAQGTTISYGRTYRAPRRMKVATIGIGYSHGFSRLLSNRGSILLGGRRVKVVGRVCMDELMVDATGVPNVAVGDEAVVIGRQGNERITVEEHASWMNAIPYTVLVGWNSRIPRRIIA